jgi:hypothetical protein
MHTYATNIDHPEQISNHRRGAEGKWKLLSCRRPSPFVGVLSSANPSLEGMAVNGELAG